jgi:transcriptional antiterminator NusG
MVQDDETFAPDEQASQEAEQPLEAESNPEAEVAARLQDPESVPQEDEVSLAESPVVEAEATAHPDERDLTIDADQELEVSARLSESDLDEDEVPQSEEPPAQDLAVSQVEAAPEKPRRERVEDRSSRMSDEGTPDFSQVPQTDGSSDGRAWYVVHCYSGYENKVRHNLEQRIESMGMKDKIFDVVVPTEEEIEVKEGKRRTVERRVFPGYILVNMVMSEESWYVVRNTPGVTSFVGQGNTPLPLRPEEVSQIVKRMEAEAPRIKVTFRQGERVRIVDGPFNDFRGTVSEIDMERAKVRVMVNFFGRETPVELDFLQVEKA